MTGRKWQMPKVPQPYIGREVLTEKLQCDSPVIFLTGKCGSGKTASVVKYCENKKNVFWYTFEKEDNDETYFLSHFLGTYKEEKAVKSSAYDRLFDFVEKAAENTEECIFVFDDFHYLKNEKIISLIVKTMEKATIFGRFILLSQKQPLGVMAKLVLSGNVTVIDESDLWFSKGEVCDLIFSYQNDKVLQDEVIERFYDITRGWPVFVRGYLSLHKSLTGFKGESFFTQPVLYDYAEQEIWNCLTKEEQQFIMDTIDIPDVTLPICKYCLDNPAIDRIYRRLQKKWILCHQDGKNAYPYLLKLFFSQKVTSQNDNMKLLMWKYYVSNQDYSYAFYVLRELEYTDREWTVSEMETAAELYYRYDDRERQEIYLNMADSMFGKENRFGAYRSIYRGLYHYGEEPEKYEKQINNALFFLNENHIPMPYLKDEDKELLSKICRDKKEITKDENLIEVKTFGTFCVKVCVDGKKLSWRTRKGCELFAYLLQMNGKPVERKNLLTVLWKDDMPNNAVAMLHNILYNIRKELSFYGLEHMIQYKNKAYLLKREFLLADLDEITHLADMVEKEDKESLLKNRQSFKEYWGIYLEDLDNEWIGIRQEYYDRIFEKGCTMIADSLRVNEEYEEAAGYYRNACQRNIYSEELMEKLIFCYGKMRNFKLCKQYYEEFCARINSELGEEPGEHLQQMYQSFWSEG